MKQSNCGRLPVLQSYKEKSKHNRKLEMSFSSIKLWLVINPSSLLQLYFYINLFIYLFQLLVFSGKFLFSCTKPSFCVITIIFSLYFLLLCLYCCMSLYVSCNIYKFVIPTLNFFIKASTVGYSADCTSLKAA